MARASRAMGSTVVVMVTELLVGFGSNWLPDIDSVLVSRPPAVGETARTRLAAPPAGRGPKSHVTTPATLVQLPCVGTAETKLTLAGSTSLKTAAEVAGPRLVTAMV